MKIFYDQNGVLVRESNFTDIDLWALDPHNDMRAMEVMEVWASDHWTPEQALIESYRKSFVAYSVFHNNHIVAMFGVVPDSFLSHRAQVWLLTTKEINNMKIRFLKLTKHFIKQIQDCYPFLYNWVDARNEQCLHWLAWTGARIYAPEAYGLDKLPFHYFVLEAK